MISRWFRPSVLDIKYEIRDEVVVDVAGLPVVVPIHHIACDSVTEILDRIERICRDAVAKYIASGRDLPITKAADGRWFRYGAGDQWDDGSFQIHMTPLRIDQQTFTYHQSVAIFVAGELGTNWA